MDAKIAGGILGVELVKKIINQKESTGDKITLPLIVAIIIGRIGCLFTGVTDGTVGNICSYFWCFDQGDGLAKHPMALYEIIFLLFFIIFLRFYLKKLDLKSGIIFRLFIILYFSLRFFLEFIKPTKALFLNLSAIQIICASFVLWYYYDIRRNYKNGE